MARCESRPMRAEAEQWLRAAERDLQAAALLLEAQIFEYCAFHCQQAVEKGMKALLADHGRAERTHSSIQMMVELERIGLRFPEGMETDLRRLDRSFTDSRYPSGIGAAPQDLYDKREAEEHLGWARRAMEFVRSNLSSSGS